MNLLHRAAKKYYQSRHAEALANLNVYFNKAAGIGEHSDLQEEIRKWIDELSNAEDALEVLDKYFDEEGKVK